MANELVIGSHNITYVKGGARVTVPIPQRSITVAGTLIAQGVISVGTSAELISELPTAMGFAVLINLDATNYVVFSELNTALTGGKLWPTTTGLNYAEYSPSGTTLYLKANSSACDVYYAIFSI